MINGKDVTVSHAMKALYWVNIWIQTHVGGSKKDDSHKRKMPNTDYSYRYHCVEELSIIKCFQVL